MLLKQHVDLYLPSIFPKWMTTWDDIKVCRLRTSMIMWKKAWMTFNLLKKLSSFLKKYVLGGISQINCYLLNLDEEYMVYMWPLN
jgi:hypothetical protein